MKIDLHCHSLYSKDSFSPIEKMIKVAKEKNLDGIAITDHDTIDGWEEAKIFAKKYNLFVVLGMEIKSTKGDILGLFLKKKVKSREPEKVMREIKDQGGIVVIPHPFHYFVKFKDDLTKYLSLIDAIEVFNARQWRNKFNKMAFDFAKKYNLGMVAGSDAHSLKEIGNAFTISNSKNLDEFKEAIKKKETQIFGKKSSYLSLVFPFLAKIKNLIYEKK